MPDEVDVVSELHTLDPADVRAAANNKRAPSADVHSKFIIVSTSGSGKPISSVDPLFFALLHFSMFPHMRGMCPKGMSIAKWAACLLRRFPREQFAEQPVFASDVFNLWQRSLVAIHSKVQFSLTPSMKDVVGRAPPAVVQGVLDIIQERKMGATLKQRLDALGPSAHQLFAAYKMGGARVLGSPQSCASLRSQNHALWDAYGHFTMMLNLNPAAKHMRVTFKIAGRDYSFTSQGHPDERAPAARERWRILARNPYACAMAAYVFLTAFCAELLNFPTDACEQRSPEGCMFGRVLAYSFKPETSSRGEIHFHGLIVQPMLQADNLERIMQNGEALKALERLLGATAAAYLPGGLVAEGHIPVKGLPPLPLPKASADHHVAMQREIPLPAISATQALDAQQKAELDVAVAQLMMLTNVHNHSFTCGKYGGQPNDANCRMDFPRPTNPTLQPYGDGATGTILQPRAHGMLVDACHTLLLAMALNHAFYVLPTGVRHARNMALYEAEKAAAKAAGKPFTKEPPPALNGQAQAGLSSSYASKYQSKVCRGCEACRAAGAWNPAYGVRVLAIRVPCRAACTVLRCMLLVCAALPPHLQHGS
jgi:hypothetical protein